MDSSERVVEVFRRVFGDGQLKVLPEHTARDLPGWDSLMHVNLVVSLEEEFGVTFNTFEIASVKCVGDFQRIVRARAA